MNIRRDTVAISSIPTATTGSSCSTRPAKSRSGTITAAELPPALETALESHHQRFSPLYENYLSDHGPMGALALHGLGCPSDDIVHWHDHYCQRLQSADSAPADYRRLLDVTLEDLALRTPEAVLSEALPALISGWARNAYHPLIRLAYGYQFGITGELAAGLSYLKWCGPDESLAALARSAGNGSDEPATVFHTVAECATTVGPDQRFDDRLRSVIDHPVFHRAARTCRADDHTLAIVSHLALDAFHGSHDFFALHLVTGAHAFRVLYPFAGEHRNAIFLLGILAGYAAAGAPAPGVCEAMESGSPNPVALAPTAATLLAATHGDDEHDIKLAFSCLCQAGYFQDPDYIRVAFDYLARH